MYSDKYNIYLEIKSESYEIELLALPDFRKPYENNEL